VNCASLPESLIESELFGYEKGAFTGAGQLKIGSLEAAHTGTVFLDEIGEIPLALQAKLLHFLQDRELVRLGSSKTRKVDVRVIAATNVDLSAAVESGAFRSDLYYRLNVFPIAIPPLRERKPDIPLLINYFLERTAKEYGRRLQFSDECIEILTAYRWPGNVRELENLVERIAILSDNPIIEKRSLPADLYDQFDSSHLMGENRVSDLEKMERDMVVEALERNKWIQQQAAKEIGLTLRQMGYRVKKFNLDGMIREGRKRRAGAMAR
jgi:Nif-specific regulatory protein